MGIPRIAVFGALALVSCNSTYGGSSSSTVLSGLDGTWEISKLGDEPTGAGSQLTIANDTATGVLIENDEGVDVGGCIATKHRTEVSLRFEGNAASGTITVYSQWTGPSDRCPTSRNPEVATVSGSRTDAGPGLEGVWEMNVGRAPVFVVEIKDNVGRAWDKNRFLNKDEPALTASVAGGNATTTAKNDDLTFAAKKR